MSFAGGCLCGGVRFTVQRRHLNAVHCYCQMCRKAHGTAFSTHAVVRPDQLEWVSDPSALIKFESSPQAFREFCPTCGAHVLVHGQTGDDTQAIPVGLFDGDPAVTILSHIFVGERVGWHQITDALPQHAGWPEGFGRPS